MCNLNSLMSAIMKFTLLTSNKFGIFSLCKNTSYKNHLSFLYPKSNMKWSCYWKCEEKCSFTVQGKTIKSYKCQKAQKTDMFLEHVKLSMYPLLQATTNYYKQHYYKYGCQILQKMETNVHNSVMQSHFTCMDTWTGTICTYREMRLWLTLNCLHFTPFPSFTPPEMFYQADGSFSKAAWNFICMTVAE